MADTHISDLDVNRELLYGQFTLAHGNSSALWNSNTNILGPFEIVIHNMFIMQRL